MSERAHDRMIELAKQIQKAVPDWQLHLFHIADLADEISLIILDKWDDYDSRVYKIYDHRDATL